MALDITEARTDRAGRPLAVTPACPDRHPRSWIVYGAPAFEAVGWYCWHPAHDGEHGRPCCPEHAAAHDRVAAR